jgi:hypothetical protein
MTQRSSRPKIGDKMPDGSDYLGLSDMGKPIYARLGEQMPDGTIYVGLSPDTDKPMYATLDDTSLPIPPQLLHSLYLTWKSNQPKSTGQVGDAEKLNTLFNNCSALDLFNENKESITSVRCTRREPAADQQKPQTPATRKP